MNSDIMQCDDQRLKRLLAADDRDIDSDPWMEHVEQCAQCQSRLRELAADDDDWRKAASVLGSNDDQIPCFGRGQETPTSWNEAMARQLLQPPSHPEMLGRLGRYEMERMIGTGGMGIVFKAFDTELNRVVAVKVLAPYLSARGSARKRFAREARAAAGVRDDHVVPIFNVESEHEPPFLVMHYVAGGSLQEKLDRDGPLEVAEVLRIGLQTAKGLAAAHAQGLIHRDVKPSNILLDEGVERALLTDFGLARAEDDACLTRSGFHPGTPHYMSPEQVRGEAIDGRSDLFSLGCVLYALCSGHSPFRADTSYAVMRRITDEAPRPIREVNASIPEWLEGIVMKLLAKSRDDRFVSAEEVAELLEGCLAHVQEPTSTPLPVDGRAFNGKPQASTVQIQSRLRLAVKRFRDPPIRKLMAAAAFGFSLLFTGVLIVLELNKGTLTIESELDDVPIRIVQGDKVVEDLTVSREGKTTRIAAGKYRVEIESEFDSAVIEKDVVTISRGGTETIKVTHGDPEKVVSYNVSEFIDNDSVRSVDEELATLVNLIQSTIEPDSWKSHTFSIVPYPQNKSLVVRQTHATHGQLVELFDQLLERRKQAEGEALGLIEKAKTEVSQTIDNLKSQLAELGTEPEQSADASRVQRELERAESLLEEITNQADKLPRRTQNLATTPTLAEATAQFNQQSAEERRSLFNPPIPDLAEEQLREGFLQAADQYRKVGESDIAAVLEKIVETGRLPKGMGSNLVASGVTTWNETGEIETQQIAPALIIKRHDSSHRLILLRSLELLYRKTGTSSKAYGDPGRSQDHANAISSGDTIAVSIHAVLPPLQKDGETPFPPVTTLSASKTVTGYPVRVLGDGTVRLPLLEPIALKGMTITEAEQVIADAYVGKDILAKTHANVLLERVAENDPLSASLIQPGATVAVYLPGLLPADFSYSPPVTFDPSGHGITGFQREVAADGTLKLPYMEPINIAGQTVREAEETIAKAVIKNQILREDGACPMLTLVSSRVLSAEKKEAASRTEFLQRIPEAGTVLVMLDDGSQLSEQMLPVARRVAESASIPFIDQSQKDATWIKSASGIAKPHKRSGAGGPQFVLIKDRQQVAIRNGLLTDKRLRDFVRQADDWLTPTSTGVKENSLVRIDCYINPGNGNVGKQIGGAYPLTTAVVAVYEDQALLLGPDSIAEYIDKGYACVARVRDEHGDQKQLPLDVAQNGPVPLLGRDKNEKKPVASATVTLDNGETKELALDISGYPASITEPLDAYDVGAAIYHIRGAHGLSSVRLADIEYSPKVDQQVLSCGFHRDGRSLPVIDLGSIIYWQSQRVKSTDSSSYGANVNGAELMEVLCPTVPAPTGCTFNEHGQLIGKYGLGHPTEKNDMTHTVFLPIATHSVLQAALEKIEDAGLKDALRSNLKPMPAESDTNSTVKRSKHKAAPVTVTLSWDVEPEFSPDEVHASVLQLTGTIDEESDF